MPALDIIAMCSSGLRSSYGTFAPYNVLFKKGTGKFTNQKKLSFNYEWWACHTQNSNERRLFPLLIPKQNPIPDSEKKHIIQNIETHKLTAVSVVKSAPTNSKSNKPQTYIDCVDIRTGKQQCTNRASESLCKPSQPQPVLGSNFNTIFRCNSRNYQITVEYYLASQ